MCGSVGHSVWVAGLGFIGFGVWVQSLQLLLESVGPGLRRMDGF